MALRVRLRNSVKLVLLLPALFFGSAAHASTDFLHIQDASQIKWQITAQNRVYLRNLHEFDPSYLACCYNYWFDASTDAGKSFLSVLLAKAAAAKSIHIGVVDKTIVSEVNYVGDW